jgi:glucose dehydrogenase
MARLRHALMALPIAATLAVSGLAGGTQTADAFVTASDMCNNYIYNYSYWHTEAWNEFVRAGAESTPYFEYAWNQQEIFRHLFSANNC